MQIKKERQISEKMFGKTPKTTQELCDLFARMYMFLEYSRHAIKITKPWKHRVNESDDIRKQNWCKGWNDCLAEIDKRKKMFLGHYISEFKRYGYKNE